MPNTVKVIDRGWNKIQKNMVKLSKGTSVSVGVQGEKGDEKHEGSKKLTNATLGSYHEFGRGNNPQRSHWRSTFDENQSKYQKALDALAVKVFSPGDGNIIGALLELGENYKADVVRKIHAGIDPPVTAASLVRKKGEPTPLDDTGQYIGSFTAVVVERSEVKD